MTPDELLERKKAWFLEMFHCPLCRPADNGGQLCTYHENEKYVLKVLEKQIVDEQ